VLEEEFVGLVQEVAIGGEFCFGFWAVAGAVESKGPFHRHFYVAFEVRCGVDSVEQNALLPVDEVFLEFVKRLTLLFAQSGVDVSYTRPQAMSRQETLTPGISSGA
jgi:hypothetical protein